MGVVEGRANRNGERGFAAVAEMAPFFFDVQGVDGTAIGIYRLVFPADFFKMLNAAFFRGSLLKYLNNIHVTAPVILAIYNQSSLFSGENQHLKLGNFVLLLNPSQRTSITVRVLSWCFRDGEAKIRQKNDRL